jgi:hypothetical protein
MLCAWSSQYRTEASPPDQSRNADRPGQTEGFRQHVSLYRNGVNIGKILSREIAENMATWHLRRFSNARIDVVNWEICEHVCRPQSVIADHERFAVA